MRWMVPSSKVGSGDWDIRTAGAGLGARRTAGFRAGRGAAPGPTCAHTGADTAMAAPSAATMIDFRMGSPSLAGGNPIGMAVFGPAYPSPAKPGQSHMGEQIRIVDGTDRVQKQRDSCLVHAYAIALPAKRGRVGERSEPGLGDQACYAGRSARPPTRPASLRSHSRRFASAFLMLRTAAEGRLCHPPPLRGGG